MIQSGVSLNYCNLHRMVKTLAGLLPQPTEWIRSNTEQHGPNGPLRQDETSSDGFKLSLVVPNFPKADSLSSIMALALCPIQAVLKTH